MKRRSSLTRCAVLTCLGGCSLSGALTSSSVDYNQALEAVTNNMLVTNVLLARDRAPLHFTDLSQIRGSLQLQSQIQVAAPFGSEYTTNTRSRDMLTGSLIVTSNPTFDVVPLNTRDFTAGITEPIDVKSYIYYLNQDRSIDTDTITDLLFSKIEISWGTGAGFTDCEFVNRPDTLRQKTYEECNKKAQEVFGLNKAEIHFSDMIRELVNLYYIKKAPSDLGPDIAVSGGDLLKGAAAFVGPGLSLQERHPERGPGNRYHLSRDNKEGVLCLAVVRPGTSEVSWQVIRSATLVDPVDRLPGADPTYLCTGRRSSHKNVDSTPQVYIYVRSVEAVFQYLGSMLNYAKDIRAIPFYIDKDRPAKPRFNVYYHGARYYVSESRPPQEFCVSGNTEAGPNSSLNPDCSHLGTGAGSEADRGDQTLFVLSVLNQLLNLHKTASEIRTTPAVQAVP